MVGFSCDSSVLYTRPNSRLKHTAYTVELYGASFTFTKPFCAVLYANYCMRTHINNSQYVCVLFSLNRGQFVIAQRSNASAVLWVVILCVLPSARPLHVCFVTEWKNIIWKDNHSSFLIPIEGDGRRPLKLKIWAKSDPSKNADLDRFPLITSQPQELVKQETHQEMRYPICDKMINAHALYKNLHQLGLGYANPAVLIVTLALTTLPKIRPTPHSALLMRTMT